MKRKRKASPCEAMDLGVATIGEVRPDGSIPTIEVGRMPGQRYVRNYDVLRQWLDKKVIKKSHLAAAEAFEADYRRAGLAPGYKSCLASLMRVDGQAGDDDGTDRSVTAYWRAQGAMESMGQRGAAAAEGVICNGDSLRTHAAKTGNTVDIVKGLLLGALDVLVVVYRT